MSSQQNLLPHCSHLLPLLKGLERCRLPEKPMNRQEKLVFRYLYLLPLLPELEKFRPRKLNPQPNLRLHYFRPHPVSFLSVVEAFRCCLYLLNP